MSRQKKHADETPVEEMTELQRLKSIPRADRTADQTERIRQLHTEECRARFVRLAAKRAGKAIKALSSLAQCANRNTYSYSDEEASEIVAVVEKAFEDMREAFSPSSSADNGAIHFSWQR